MFDCRNDSDVLWHHFKVKLGNVLDLQLLDVLHRRTKPKSKKNKKALPETRDNEYWKRVVNNVERLWGYKKCLQEYLEDDALVSIKDKGSKYMLSKTSKADNVWAVRPLRDSLKSYCAVDTQAMFPLFTILSAGKELSTGRDASTRYVDQRRSYVTLPKSKDYTFNPFLPLDIIDVDSSTTKNTCCTGCERMFPKDEYSTAQLKKKTQLCRVCKCAKQELDNTKQREKRVQRKERSRKRKEYDKYGNSLSDSESDLESDSDCEMDPEREAYLEHLDYQEILADWSRGGCY